MLEKTQELLDRHFVDGQQVTLEEISKSLSAECSDFVFSSNEEYANRLKSLQECIDVQSSNGNYDYSSYMLGMANGLILARHIMTGSLDTEPPYLSQPAEWLENKTSEEPAVGTRRLGDGTAAHVR